MGIFDNVRNWLLSPLLTALNVEQRTRLMTADKARAYRLGEQAETLRFDRQKGQANDNITLNFIGLAVDRSVSLLFGKGVEFNLPGEGETAEGKYIAAVMDANKQEILLHTLALLGGEAGTVYLRIVPPGKDETGKDVSGARGRDGVMYPRLMAMEPQYIEIETEPEDIDIVRRYLIQYPIEGPDGKPAIRKISVERGEGDTWQSVYSLIQDGSEVRTDVQPWPYDFPPILHWKNLPSTGTPYGQPDITPDVIRLQDRVNFLASNISKIIRLYAHPQRIGKNVSKQEILDLGPDKMLLISGDNADVNQLEQLGDLIASQQFYLGMRQSLFDVTRTVDISSVHDKLGSLTNFGLRVLYQDALQKLATKRELYGDGLLELVRRLLVIGGFAATDPGEIIWPDPLPANQVEEVAGLQFDLTNQLVSRQTVSTKRGYSWEDEQTRMDAEDQMAYENLPEQ